VFPARSIRSAARKQRSPTRFPERDDGGIGLNIGTDFGRRDAWI
jgi:hypothetical protein